MRTHVKQWFRTTSPTALVCLSFFFVIFIGGVLLAMPFSSRTGNFTNPVDSFFVATSATCVTGLVPFDTWTHWNMFGQIVVLALIQLGGLGLVTFITGFTLLFRRKMGLRNLRLAVENTNADTGLIRSLIRIILSFTISCEIIGAILLSLRFIPQFGAYGIWISIFTSISAYCNAGFDIMGYVNPDSSLIMYANDPLVTLTIALLVIIGGIGFVVISDIYYSKLKPFATKTQKHRLSFHSVIAIFMTVILLIIGTVCYFIFEYDNTLDGMTIIHKLLVSFFQSVSSRTAGFASVDIASELNITKSITIILMFIGACPGSTGGGIKATTFLVIIGTILSVIRGETDTNIFHHKVSQKTVYRAISIIFIALFAILCCVIVISICDPDILPINVIFESVSAFGTVGLSASVTSTLSNVSKIFVIFTMFIGRVGPVSLGMIITKKSKPNMLDSSAILPEGKVIVG